MKQFKSYKKTEIPLYEHCTPNSFQCAKITLLSNCTPSPLTRRGQGEVEMAHKYAFSVQKCAMNLSDMKKIITNQNANYQILTTNY